MEDDLRLFHDIATTLLKAEAENPVGPTIEAEAMNELLDLELTDQPLEEWQLRKSLEELVLNTPRTCTNKFFNQLFGGRNGKAVLGDLLAVLMNNSMYTYKVAGVQVGVEKEIIQKMNLLTGYGPLAGGTITPGASLANLMAMIMARDHFHHDIRNSGAIKGMVMYTSKESHYSIAKNASFMGIGREAVRYIDVDEIGRMNPEKLEIQIRKDKKSGFLPFMVNATAGTTVLGVFDPLEPIADICSKFNLWLHVDGAYGGSTIFSRSHRHLINAIERSDSFVLNAHKMLNTPMSCSILLVKNRKKLFRSFANDASYLYQTHDDEYNPGKTSLQCGRRNDALKLWTLWKYEGTDGLRNRVDKQFQLGNFARDFIRNHPDYSLHNHEEGLSVCFNYKDIPASWLCKELYEKEKALIGYGDFNGKEFIRLVTVNTNNEKEDILGLFKTIEEFVKSRQSKPLLRKKQVV